MKKFLVVLTRRDEDAYSDELCIVQANSAAVAVDLVVQAARGERSLLPNYVYCSARLLNEVLAYVPLVEPE